MKLQLVNKTGHCKIDNAISILQERYVKKLAEIENLTPKSYFTYTKDTNIQVAKKIREYFESDNVVLIKSYRSRWPWSKAIGSSNGKRIIINSRKFNEYDAEFYAGHLSHELCHMDELDYSHGSNYITEKKKFSVPYFFGYLISGKVKISDLVGFNEK